MKKIYLIISAIILILIVAFGIYSIKYNSPISTTNTKIIEDYSMLKDNIYLNYLLASEVSLDNLFNITDGKLAFVWDKDSKDKTGYYCADTKAEQIEYYHYAPGRDIDGGWYYIYVIDCNNFYWIIQIGDSMSGRVYGPFDK